jgi:maltooligosyltrehalose trehalohydrolase
VDGAVLSSEVLLLRYFGDGDEFALIVNLGCDLDLSPAPEPLLAPPRGTRWAVWWSSESVKYGGSGTPRLNARAVPHLVGESAVLLRATASDVEDHEQQ